MIFEVFATEARETHGIEGEAVGAALVERVRRNLENRRLGALRPQGGEFKGQIDRIGRRQPGGPDLTVDGDGTQGAQRRRGSHIVQDPAREPGGGRLPVGSRDTDEAERLAGVAREECGEMGYGGPGVADGQLREVDIGGALDHGGTGPGTLGGFDERVAIDPRPRNRAEEVAGADQAGVRTQRGELRGRNPSPPRLEARFVEPSLDLSIRRCLLRQSPVVNLPPILYSRDPPSFTPLSRNPERELSQHNGRAPGQLAPGRGALSRDPPLSAPFHAQAERVQAPDGRPRRQSQEVR